LQPLRRAARSHHERERQGLSEDHRRGPLSVPEGWSQSQVNMWLPPRSHILKDTFNGRWRVSHLDGTFSRSWMLHGMDASALLCVKEAWRVYTWQTGVRCDIEGIFTAEEQAAVDEVSPQAAPAAAEAAETPVASGKGSSRTRGGRASRGRGRGRAGRGQSSAAASSSEPPPVQIADAPVAIAAPARAGSSSSSSSSKSDSSSQSSSSSC